jgi:hypothetical protein
MSPRGRRRLARGRKAFNAAFALSHEFAPNDSERQPKSKPRSCVGARELKSEMLDEVE